mgnify:CR=1 FL=1|jgi:hypothetical protein
MKKIVLAVLGVTALFPAMAVDSEVAYPTGYRQWSHVKSMVIEKEHALFASFGGVHHLYANKKAMDGYKAGHFPNGAVIVFDLLEANRSDGAIVEGDRKVLGVMQKDAKKFPATGGWGFEGFAGGDKTKRVVGKNAATACFECHTAQKGRDFVFSSYRN